MGNGRPEIRIKGLSHDAMARLKRFTRSLNAELALLGDEPLDLIEAHQQYQGLIDGHHGTLADLVRKIAAERTAAPYVEEGEGEDEPLDELEQAEQEEQEE